jgi:glucose/arabinose dehydrogenase
MPHAPRPMPEARRLMPHTLRLTALAFITVVAGTSSLPAQILDCDGHITSLVAPAGSCVRLFADTAGPVRHVVIHPTGQVVAALNVSPGAVRFIDSDGDGRADKKVRFGPGRAATGIAWRDGWLYLAVDDAVLRYRWPATATEPDTTEEWIATKLPLGTYGWAHTMKGIAVGTDGMVYVSIGSATDNCQVIDRGEKSPGKWPCSELEDRAGVWRLEPPAVPGGPWKSSRFAIGLRNTEAIAFDPASGRVWGATQGRDALNRTWEWADSISANQPAEMLELLVENGDYGWPYCQGNWSREKTSLIRAPEYASRPELLCAGKVQPVMGFPGHWSAMAIAVVNSAAAGVPHPGLFIAFHGSRDRRPLMEDGHFLVFIPMDETGRPSGPFRILLRSAGAPGTIRPAGVAVSIRGGIYVTDDEHEKIYLIEPHPGRTP